MQCQKAKACMTSNLELVSWDFDISFQHIGYIRDDKSGMESYTYTVKKGQRYINLKPGRLNKKLQARFSGLLQNPAWKRSATILVEWEGIKKQENRWSKKGKREKVKDTQR